MQMQASRIERIRVFLNTLLANEPKQAQRISKTQAQRSLELIKKTLWNAGRRRTDRRYDAVCYLYKLEDVEESKVFDGIKDTAVISAMYLRQDKKFLRQLKHLLKLHRAAT